jgi:hypothetical protein
MRIEPRDSPRLKKQREENEKRLFSQGFTEKKNLGGGVFQYKKPTPKKEEPRDLETIFEAIKKQQEDEKSEKDMKKKLKDQEEKKSSYYGLLSQVKPESDDESIVGSSFNKMIGGGMGGGFIGSMGGLESASMRLADAAARREAGLIGIRGMEETGLQQLRGEQETGLQSLKGEQGISLQQLIGEQEYGLQTLRGQQERGIGAWRQPVPGQLDPFASYWENYNKAYGQPIGTSSKSGPRTFKWAGGESIAAA